MRVGFIGLGVMGKPCVNNLLKAGHEVWVWARRRESAQEVLAAGARWSAIPAELAAEVEVLVTNVPNAIDVEHVLLGSEGACEGAPAGLICADMSTISPMAARRIAEQLQEYEIDFLDCPVSGGEVGAINGTLSFMVGGKAAALEKVRPVLAAMGQTITHIGASGAGQVAKACNQIAVGVTILGIAEVMKLARACGVDPAPVREALMGGFAASRVLEVHGQRMIDDDFAPGFRASLHQKDAGIILETARELGISLPESERVAALVCELVARGQGDLDSSAIAKLIWEQN